MRGSRGGGDGGRGFRPPPPPEKSQNIGFLSSTGKGPLKNHKASIQCWAIINGTPTKRQKWRDDGPLMVVFGSFLPLINLKK